MYTVLLYRELSMIMNDELLIYDETTSPAVKGSPVKRMRGKDGSCKRSDWPCDQYITPFSPTPALYFAFNSTQLFRPVTLRIDWVVVKSRLRSLIYTGTSSTIVVFVLQK